MAMRRFDRTYASFPNANDDRRMILPREDTWLRSSVEQLTTTQNKLRQNVAQNNENIALCRQENVSVAENLRTAANMWQQFGDKVARLADQMDYERQATVASLKCFTLSLIIERRPLYVFYIAIFTLYHFYMSNVKADWIPKN